jgi:hypothetical protein
MNTIDQNRLWLLRFVLLGGSGSRKGAGLALWFTETIHLALGLTANRGNKMVQVTSDAYKRHRVFADLERYAGFYKRLAMSVFSFASMGTKAFGNIDTYTYSSMQGTLDSIRSILLVGRINDAYALLRKFHDSAIINVYANLYLSDHFSIENFVVEKIQHWVAGKERLPEYRIMSQYIRNSVRLKEINDALMADERYKRIRDRCNDHTHYNFYRHVMLNDNEIRIESRDRWLDAFASDSRDLFILHLAYIFSLNDHYMMSSDHLDALECGFQPEEDSQYWVAPFVQEIFDEIITPWRPDITDLIKKSTAMQLA